MPLAMIFGGVYTLSIFIACRYTVWRGVYTPRGEYSFVYHAQSGINVFCSSKMNP